jgi:hypothetical protein
MILPISFVNFNDTSIQESLNDFVQTELSGNFELKSKDEVAEAMQKAADSNDSENCSEEACIRIMGKSLDVDYTFNFKIIDTGQGWDLTAIRSHFFEEATIRRNELCEDCSLSKARILISAMLSEMITGEVSLKGGKARLLIESTPKSAVFTDGRPQGETPLNLSVDANKRFDILMVAEGYNDFTEELILKPGQKVSINKKLVRKRGSIRITSEPSGANIYIDGKLELDSQDKTLKTPADLYILFGEHELELKYERYEDSTQTLKINKRKLGTKNIILKPKSGRLIIRVPSEFKSADVYVDGKSIGDMDGLIAKTFEVRANVSQTIQVKDGDFESKIKSFEIGPDGHKNIEFSEFSDLRLVELRKQKAAKKEEERERERMEFRDRQDSLEAERKRKELFAKMKKLFKDTRVEIRTFGHMLDAEAFSLYFYFDPRLGIGYARGKQNQETGKSYENYSCCVDYTPLPSLKYRTELSAFVIRYRIPANLLSYGGGLSSLRYLDDSLGISLFAGTGKATDQSSGMSSKLKPSGWTIDYVWYSESGISILFGLGFIKYNAEEEWIRNYEDFAGPTDWSWGLFNIGYMF